VTALGRPGSRLVAGIAVVTSVLGACSTTATTATATATATTTAAATSVAVTSVPATTVAATTAAPTSPPTTTAAPTTIAAPTTAPPTTDAIQHLPGVAALIVTVAGDDPARPTFSWSAPAGAVTFQLAVQTADGVPLWGWIGSDSTVVLGGAARSADVEGPTLTGPSRVRVYAFGAGHLLLAVSGWVPLAG
jgi:hypothetical protein